MKRSVSRALVVMAVLALICTAWPTPALARPPDGNVAIFGAVTYPEFNSDVLSKISATGLFRKVDVFPAAGTPVPTLTELQQYSAVLVYTDTYLGDAVGWGDVLADYMDAGGGVVLSAFGYDAQYGIGIAGRIVSGGYLPLTQAGQDQGARLLMVKDTPEHPIFEGVNSFDGGTASYHNSPISITPDATLLAHWTNGQPLVAVKQPTAGKIVGLNFYPVSSDAREDFWSVATDGGRLMANALLWAAGSSEAPSVNAGFVTGGGWMYSPAGAYTLDRSLEGKATFGFVSQYLKDAKVPRGSTKFQFHAAGFTFKSTGYDWLVVGGSQAQYKGSGTVNGEGDYGFMLTAKDGAPDTLRLEVWDKATDATIYDNGSLQPLERGSIMIHTGKK